MSGTNAVITDAGHRLQAALLGTGKGLVFTRAVTGAGLAEGELAAQTAVTEERQTLSLQPAMPLEDAKTRVQVLLSNAGLEAGYTMHQLGFYAKAQDAEEEILYALVQDETGDIIPADAESPGFTADWSYVFAYGNADSVTVTVDPAGMITWDKVGAAGGVAPLGPDGKVPEEHLPEMDYLPLAGGTMTGAIDMNGQQLTNLAAPVSAGDAARKADVDAVKTLAQGMIVTGTYIGDGSKNRTINLGFTPHAVLVMENGEGVRDIFSSTMHYGGFALTGSPVQYDWYVHESSNGTSTVVAITTNGFIVNNEGTAFATSTMSNNTGSKYHYIAFRK